MRPQRYVIYQDLVATSLPEDLVRDLPRLRFRLVSDHNEFCRRLHTELEKMLQIQVLPLFCETSEILGEEPKQFARDFDCMTLKPLSGRHQVWLDFRKPLNLGPDRCSKLFYAENREVLRPYRSGGRDPEDLEIYIQFLTEQLSG